MIAEDDNWTNDTKFKELKTWNLSSTFPESLQGNIVGKYCGEQSLKLRTF